MKKPVLMLIGLCFMLTAYAQTDTIPETRELQEVVVEAQNQRASASESVYVPSKRQKDASADAVALLSQMAIPQLDVNPATKSVKTASGNEVAIFIDYMEASQQDLEGMRTADVKKVEYLLYPSDARFHGAQFVINFIMQKYEWGGYTKLNADYTTAENKTFGSAYSKFVYKKMTLDLYADERYTSYHHSGAKSTEWFSFIDLYGKGPKDITRYSEPLSTNNVSNTNNISFRARYASDKTQISNQMSFNFRTALHEDNEYRLYYSDGYLPASTSKMVKSGTSGTFNYDFSLYRTFNQKLSFYLSANYRYGHNKSNSDYYNSTLQIGNDAKENSHYTIIAPQLTWNINSRNSFIAYIFGEYMRNDVDYYGNSPSYQKYDIWGGLGGVRYTYSQNNWYAGTQFGWQYARNNLIGTVSTEDTYPKGNVFASYSPNQKNRYEFLYVFGKNIPLIYQKSPNMLQQDALLWYSGNPNLKNWWDNIVVLSYLWLPSNRWQLYTVAEYYISSNRLVTTYLPEAPNGTILRTYTNDGDFRQFRFGVSATGKFLNSKLIANVNPQLYLHHTTGEYTMTKNILKCTAQLTWYFGNFYLFGWYQTPATFPQINSGTREHVPSQYLLQIGWGKGSWKFSATAHNFLRTNWVTSRQILSGQYYRSNVENYGTSMHQRFQVNVTYTFNYGKKVQTGNEVGVGSSAESAILH